MQVVSRLAGTNPAFYTPTINLERGTMNLTENAKKVLESRYLKKDKDGKVIETPETMLSRVAHAVAQADALYGSTVEEIKETEDRFYQMMDSLKFLPNSPTLMNAGRELGMLSACFVLPIHDSINDIFDTVKNTARIQKAGGGTGFSFDELRPTGDYISSSGGTTSGPISFWRVLSEATNAIQQGAFRRGANMGMMSVDHPDIINFIRAKQDLNAFTNFNISVKLTDDFMSLATSDQCMLHRVENKRTGIKYYIPRGIKQGYSIHDLTPVTELECVPGVTYYTVKDVFEMICEFAWRTGEPGVCFIDTTNNNNPAKHLGRIEAFNPCGEMPLLPYESCNLGSINLTKFYKVDEHGFNDDWYNCIEWGNLGDTVIDAVHFLDNIIDINRYQIPEIESATKRSRKIGLGIMGFADLLYMLNIPYDSDMALEIANDVMDFIKTNAKAASNKLNHLRTKGIGIINSYRNATITTIAPTGTISIIAGCSSGIEPNFNLAYWRNILGGERILETNTIFSKVIEKSPSAGVGTYLVMEKIANTGKIPEFINPKITSVFRTAKDISPEWHVKMQAAFQKHVDSSISKTINMDSSATVEDVKKVYIDAWKLKCKGVTVYRDGCRNNQPMSTGKNETIEVKTEEPKQSPVIPIKTPEVVSAVRIRQNTPFGHMHVTVSIDSDTGKELEVFAQLGKGGDVAASDLEAICRMVSMYLRVGGSIEHVIKQLNGIGSNLSIPTKDGRVSSLPDGLSKALSKYRSSATPQAITDKEPSIPTKCEIKESAYVVKCPECESGTIVFSEGCQHCDKCGYAKC